MRYLSPLAALLLWVWSIVASADEVASALKTLRAVGPESAGQQEAAHAWQTLAAGELASLPAMLTALDDASPTATNWIRTAIDAVVERQLARGDKLPTAELERFVLQTTHAPKARRLAYELLTQADPSAPARLLPGMLDDPGRELRREAVARVMGQAAALPAEGAEAKALYHKALDAAVDVDQIRQAAQCLRDRGEKIDLARQLGLIVRWKLIGPFDNTSGKGFDAVYPPEQGIDLTQAFPGKHGPVRWIDHATSDEMGLIDLNRALGQEKGAVAYARAEFHCDRRQEVEFRLTSFNAVKLWLNGRLVDQRRVYHGGSQFDQYTSRGTLQPGRNVLLVKVCQNEQTQEWAVVWTFQLRVCDPLGRPVRQRD